MTRQTPRLLLAASGSQASRHATDVAAELASKFDAQLVILHVVPPVEYRVGRLAPTLADQPTARRPADQPRVARGAPSRVGARNERKDHPRRRRPRPRDFAVAQDRGADLLVIGSTPRVMPSALTCKTRRWLQTRAPCPVLPVTADGPALAHPGIESVLVT